VNLWWDKLTEEVRRVLRLLYAAVKGGMMVVFVAGHEQIFKI
jgi:hypothetical protein